MFENVYLFEISWEVCNKIGGIYTVITSKLPQATKNFKNYYLLGIYNNSTKQNFESINTPEKFIEKEKLLNEIGIKIHFGKWNENNIIVDVILIDYLDYSIHTNEIKSNLWENYKIDSLNSKWFDYDEAIVWSWCCGIVIEKLTENIDSKIITHAHEWMSGGAIFYLNSNSDKNKYKTIFTTHATMIGRALSSRGKDILHFQKNISIENYAYEIGVHTKHKSEKVLANISTIFTTVSDITNDEAVLFYEKSADILLYNGFDPILEINKKKEKNDLKISIQKYFHNFYEIDFNNTKIAYISGRNEVKNKGVDLLIESLGSLNQKLKEENSNKTLVVFFLILIGEFKFEPLITDSIKNYNNEIHSNKLQPYVPLSTHILPINNEIIQLFINHNLLNTKEDKIKVILNPSYISEKEFFFTKNYYNVISGSDLGIFPSFYEPWGYTPIENLAYGIPTITTDMSGFGKYFKEKIGVKTCNFILERKDKTDYESSKILKNEIEKFINKSDNEIEKMKYESKEIANIFSWNLFYNNYIKVYELALKKS